MNRKTLANVIIGLTILVAVAVIVTPNLQDHQPNVETHSDIKFSEAVKDVAITHQIETAEKLQEVVTEEQSIYSEVEDLESQETVERSDAFQETESACEIEVQDASITDSSSGYYSGDFKSAGVVYDSAGTRYTWYSQNSLPGSGLAELNANGRYVDEAGYIRDNDGYIAVSSSDHAKGSILDTPFGPAKVYDTGCPSGTIDVYTNF